MDSYVEQRKRSSNSINDENYKRQKTNVLLTSEMRWPITRIEDLANELFYEIFDYLDSHHAFKSFYHLNRRFQNLFLLSNSPIKINISSISKCSFEHYLTYIICPHSDRIQSFRVSNPFAADICLLLFPLMNTFIQLETLIINNIESDFVEKLINHLSSLPILSSLTIISNGYVSNENDLYLKIFRLPTLKYCQILFETLRCRIPLITATNEFSSIEHLVIKHKISLNQIDSLLSYVPYLFRLSLTALDGRRTYRIKNNLIKLNYLTDISLGLSDISLNEFEELIRDLFSHVQVLKISSDYARYSNWNTEYINADRWEQILSTHMPNLSVFDFEYRYYRWYDNSDRQSFEIKIQKFHSTFWIKRQCFFEFQYYEKGNSRRIIFYTINPFKRKTYTLIEQPNKNLSSYSYSINENAVRYLDIRSTDAMNQFSGYFSNATKLTLSETFDAPFRSLVTNLNRIIPLRQLVQLNIYCHRLSFEQIIQLLYSAINIHTLELESILFYRTNPNLLEQTDLFQTVSNMNRVNNVRIINESTLDKIQLLVKLLPRLEYLTLNLYKEHLENTVRFLVTNPNNYTYHLSTLCISKQRRDLAEILRNLMETEKLIDEYTIKVIHRQLYLWWSH